MTITWTKKDVLRELRDVLFFMLASLAQIFLLCPRCNSFRSYSVVWLFTFMLWLFLWKGNGLLANFLTKKIPWIKYPLRRLWIGIISTIGYTLLVVVGIMEFVAYSFNFTFGSGYKSSIYVSIGITIVISLILHSREFFLHWQRAAKEAERYEKESITAKFESLRNQVNPHFLFNSLNVLTNLVYEDQEKAVKFIKQLSQVYRYVLETKDKELILLEEELEFLKSYLFLQQLRFGEKLRLQVDLAGVKCLIPPLVLQMLVENAIKHNIISTEDPLTISISASGSYITVKNNLQRRLTTPDEASGIGLENIQKRYSFLTSLKVEVIENEYFIVKLPMLPIDI